MRWGILYRKTLPKESQQALFQLVLLAVHKATALRGCHDDIGQLGLEHMLALICDCFFWPHMAVQAREHIEKCHPCLTFKVKQPQHPGNNCSHTSIRTGLPGLFMPRTREREGRQHPSGNRPLHLICPGICDPITDCPNNS